MGVRAMRHNITSRYSVTNPVDTRPGWDQAPAGKGARPGGPLDTERAVVSWEGPGQPIVLTVHGPAGEVAVPMVPKRALELARELLTRGVQAIKADQWDTPPL